MEHLPCLEGETEIEIPYLGVEEYDNGEFATYPQRHGWDKYKIFARNFAGKTSEDLETFLQSWLYFGLLICTFRTVGIVVRTGDFVRTVRGRKLITTERLPELLDEWNSRENIALIKLRGGDPTEAIKINGKVSHWSVILVILYEVHDYVNRFCNEQGQSFSKEIHLSDINFRPVSSEVSMSIIALADAISRAASIIYESNLADLRLSWGTSSLLTQRLFDKNWCPKDLAMLTYDKARTMNVQFYASCMPYSRGSLEHMRCTDTTCCVDKVDEATYIISHVRADCDCSHVEASRDIISIIERGGIPLVSFRKAESEKTCRLRVLEYSPGSRPNKYVAISHVWSDGMGNPNKNSLPTCRLLQLQAQVDRLYDAKEDDFPHGGYRYRKSHEPSTPWEDFYAMVKAEVTDPTYPAAGFWMDTLCVPVQKSDRPFRDMAIRNMAIVYGKADRVLVVDSWIQKGSRTDHITERSARIFMSNWQRRLWTLQERILAKQLYFQYRDGPQHRDDLIVDLRLDVHFGRGYYHSIASFGVLGTVTLPDFPPGLEERPSFSRFDTLAFSLGHRTTSRASDETVCLASMMDLNTIPLQIISSEKVDERMVCLLRMVGRFRQHRIFDAGPRCPLSGFGWAPSSFLNQTKSTSPADYGDDTFRFADLDTTGGLIVSYSGVLLGTAGHLLNLSCAILFPDDHTKGLFVMLRRSEVGKEIAPWDRSMEFALISYKPLKKVLDTPKGQSIAIIGTLNRGAAFDGFQIKHVCRATLISLDEELMCTYRLYWKGKDVSIEEAGDAKIIEGKVVDESQQWCVI